MSLGTDGFGRSDTRAALRRHFRTDAESITAAVVAQLAHSGELPSDAAAKAVERYRLLDEQVDPGKDTEAGMSRGQRLAGTGGGGDHHLRREVLAPRAVPAAVATSAAEQQAGQRGGGPDQPTASPRPLPAHSWGCPRAPAAEPARGPVHPRRVAG